MRFARIKVKIQRVTGYISLATFLIVFYGLMRDLYASPYFDWKPGFFIFVGLLSFVAVAVLAVMAELDWHYVFPSEMGVAHSKDPMFFSVAFRDATFLHKMYNDDPTLEAALTEMYKSVNREHTWIIALELARRA